MATRPTCATCPHYEDKGDEEQGDRDGYCRRHAPIPVNIPMPLRDGQGLPNCMVVMWPEVWADESCGEHPDFAAYLAARKAEARTDGEG